MADESVDKLRLTLMQDVLPITLALVDRVKKGGAKKVVEAFSIPEDPFRELRDEGEPAAKSVRDRLDDLSPGLGNPVMPVQVDIYDESSTLENDSFEEKSLSTVLIDIESRLTLLEEMLDRNSSVKSSSD